MNGAFSVLFVLVVVVLVPVALVVLFMVFRAVWLWYWRVDDVVARLDRMTAALERLAPPPPLPLPTPRAAAAPRMPTPGPTIAAPLP